jgi:hypothetical protein
MAHTIIFGGKRYQFGGLHETKSQAQGAAKLMRKKGYLARVKQIAGDYRGARPLFQTWYRQV